MSEKPVSYHVKVQAGEVTHRLLATFRTTYADIVNQHPIAIFGPIFRETLQTAAAAFADPNVREVPIYAAGQLEPVAYLTRWRPAPPTTGEKP